MEKSKILLKRINKPKKKHKSKKHKKPKEERYDLSIKEPSANTFPPLWTNQQKPTLEFPIYRFKVEKTPHIVDEKNCSKKDSWQSIRLDNTNEHDFAESLLGVK